MSHISRDTIVAIVLLVLCGVFFHASFEFGPILTFANTYTGPQVGRFGENGVGELGFTSGLFFCTGSAN